MLQLNSNTESGWSRWERGKDGYPTLDYYNELSGIDEIAMDNKSVDVDYTHPCEVYNMQGLLISDNINNLTTGLYIIRQGSIVKKIIVE